jgi:mutator protein MutT
VEKNYQPHTDLPHYQVTAGVVWNGAGQFLIAQRQEGSALGGLWEFPGGKQEPGESLESCLRRELREELGIQVAVGALLTVVEHAYAHLRITLHVFECQLLNGRPQARECAAWRWVRWDEVDRFAFSAADQQVLRTLRRF